jgi:large subunit ribosomal protein L47
MRAIKHALTERFYTWEDAVKAAEEDPEINLHAGNGQIYQPSIYDDEPSDWAAEPNAQTKPTTQ